MPSLVISAYLVHHSAFCYTNFLTILSTRAGIPLTLQSIFAFQQRHASDRCYNITFDFLALSPSGKRSVMSLKTDALSSKSKLLSIRYLVTVFIVYRAALPSNCLVSKLEIHFSTMGTRPLIPKTHTLQAGSQKPHPGPFPTAPPLKFEYNTCFKSLHNLTCFMTLYLYL